MEADRDKRDSEWCQEREGLVPLIWSDDEGIWQRDQWILMNMRARGIREGYTYDVHERKIA